MLRVIIEKEIRDLLTSTKFTFAFVVCALLIVLSFYVGAGNYRVSVEHYEASKAENLRQMEGITDWLYVEQNRIFLPPQPLATLVTGVSNDIGRTTEVEPRGELTAHDSRFNEEPVFAVFRFLDLSFVFQIVLSLFAILLGYDAVSGEKEQGTLKLALSNAVSRSTFIIGKLIGAFIALSVSLLMAVAAGCLLLPLLGVPMTGTDWIRLSLIILTGLLFVGVFLTASVFVSTVTYRTSSSFLVLLVIWIMTVLIIPRASVLMAGRAIDVPSVDEVASQKASYASGLWKDFRTGMADFTPPDSKDVEALMESFNQHIDSLTNIRDEKMDEFASRLNEDRYNRQLQQQAVAFNLARTSPATSLSLATAELAGTSLSLKDRFRDGAKSYQQKYADFLKEKTGMNVGGRMIVIKLSSDDEEAAEQAIDPTEIPAYTYGQPSLSRSVENAAPDMGLLAMFSFIFFVGAYVAFNRYDAR